MLKGATTKKDFQKGLKKIKIDLKSGKKFPLKQ